mmetsp:Transcript_24784/g.36355  ORF Transcript_24784/g.36355 Transcript_24784/m.36355 type:complete len:508 (-) Transcript_24784:288-1811(-)
MGDSFQSRGKGIQLSQKSKRRTHSQKGRLNFFLVAIFAVVVFVAWFNYRTIAGLGANQIETTKSSSFIAAPESSSSIAAPKIAYAISVVKCGDAQTTSSGLMDAAIILRHSVHQTSIRNPGSSSKYDYQMYAIVHRDALKCSRDLETVGFKLEVVDPPINPKDIRGDFLRTHIHKAWCCGSDEFIKLYAYGLTKHPLVVHLDIDFMMMNPMDKLFDLMLTETPTDDMWNGVEMQFKDGKRPARLEAAITRDYQDIAPGYKAAFQAGFIVLRPDPSVIKRYTDVVLEGNFVRGNDCSKNGWGGLGYGCLTGDMAMQGLGAYYYDEVAPNTSIELNMCRYNFMAGDNLYRPGGKSYMPGRKQYGKCRDNSDSCEDCTQTDLDLVYNVHLTNCRKPWNCPGKAFNRAVKNKDLNPGLRHLVQDLKGQSKYIDLNIAPYDKCMDLQKIWHSYRSDLEDKLYKITGDDQILSTRNGKFESSYFLGHCEGIGKYTPMNLYGKETLSRLQEVWN